MLRINRFCVRGVQSQKLQSYSRSLYSDSIIDDLVPNPKVRKALNVAKYLGLGGGMYCCFNEVSEIYDRKIEMLKRGEKESINYTITQFTLGSIAGFGLGFVAGATSPLWGPVLICVYAVKQSSILKAL